MGDSYRRCVLQGSDPGVRDRDGCTPLYCAAAWDRGAAVRALDALGCPAWARSGEGRTAVHVAAEQGWTDLIDLLVRHLKNKVRRSNLISLTPSRVGLTSSTCSCATSRTRCARHVTPCS